MKKKAVTETNQYLHLNPIDRQLSNPFIIKLQKSVKQGFVLLQQ